MSMLRFLILPLLVLPVAQADTGSPRLEGVTDSAGDSIALVTMAALYTTLKPLCTISIDTLTVSDMKLYDTLDVMLESENIQPAGFALKVATENGLIDILDILPGEIIDSCRWDLFNARQLPSDDPSVGPAEVWQIVALAHQVSGTKSPLCYGLKRPASLARLVVSSAHRANVPDTTIGIFFYWESCRDNAISDCEGSSTLFSKSLEDRVPIRLNLHHAAFPTRAGTPDQCISDRAANPPRRAIVFVNGGVVFKAALAPALPDSAGLSH
jgi:hypothetical protein